MRQRTAELLEGYHRIVKFLIVIHDDLLVLALTDNQTSGTPTEFVHAPEGRNQKEETVHQITKEGE